MSRIMQILLTITMAMAGFFVGPMPSSALAQPAHAIVTASADATITGGASAATNFGSSNLLVAGNYQSALNMTLVKFDVSAVSSAATITTATLSMRRTAGVPGTVLLNVVTGSWNESTVTWNLFANAFGASVGSFTLPIGNPVTVSTDITSTVQGWVDGTLLNHGLVLRRGSTSAGFSSKEGFVAPTLDIYYTVPTCSDGIQNQGEAGVDCDGPCAACPTCSDGVKNGVETDIDCGGGTCAACDEGAVCGVDADCLTGSCSAGTCAWPVCDGSGACGDVSSGCTGCALAGQCAAAYDACALSQACLTFADCLGACQDQACFDTCYAGDPSSGAVYDALLTCVYCDTCALDCPESFQDFCGP